MVWELKENVKNNGQVFTNAAQSLILIDGNLLDILKLLYRLALFTDFKLIFLFVVCECTYHHYNTVYIH